jgi:hypothetical protein
MNGTLTLTCDDPRPTAYFWAVVVVFSFAFHILLLLLVSLPPLVVSSGDSSERMEVAVSLSPGDIAALEALVRETTAPEAPARQEPTQAVPAPGVAPAPEKKAPVPETKAPVPEAAVAGKEPTEARTAAPAKKAEAPAENLPPLVQSSVSVADDTAKGQAKPPDDAKYLGATNTEAADRSKKEKLGPDPRIEGETGEVRSSGRRGETENKLAKRDDPQAGSVEKQGTPVPGKPPEPPKEIAQAYSPVPKPSTVRGPLPRDTRDTRAAEKDQPPGQVAAREEESARALNEAKEALRSNPKDTPSFEKQLQNLKDAAGDTKAGKEAARLLEQLSAETGPDGKARPAKPTDPELARVQAIVSLPGQQAAWDNSLTQPGSGTREGRPGHEGDGRVREGESLATSDVITATFTSAAKEGDVAFSKKATPEIAYLKPFFQRMDAKWKAIFYANNRALSRLDFGQVAVRFTLGKDGKVREAVALERQGTISDRAVEACLDGIRQAGPHEPFPAALAGREQLTEVIQFLYR